MAVYVDDLVVCVQSREWPWREACHLFADDDEELHAFAAGLGLKREWHQAWRWSHYDLTARMRELALRRGARAVDRKFVTEFLRRGERGGAANQLSLF